MKHLLTILLVLLVGCAERGSAALPEPTTGLPSTSAPTSVPLASAAPEPSGSTSSTPDKPSEQAPLPKFKAGSGVLRVSTVATADEANTQREKLRGFVLGKWPPIELFTTEQKSYELRVVGVDSVAGLALCDWLMKAHAWKFGANGCGMN